LDISSLDRDDGIALVIVMMALTLLLAFGVALVVNISSETMIAANYRDAQECMYAAEAAIERALVDLRLAADWNLLLAGASRSNFVDGAPAGPRAWPGGPRIDLTTLTNLANCARVSSCSSSDMDRITADRPWGVNNPRWQPYAYGRLMDLLPAGRIESRYYVVVFVGDDASENDGDPARDGQPGPNPGAGIVTLRAEAFGLGGVRGRIDATVARAAPPGTGLRVLSWRRLS
jgi:hypothetical protein